MHSTLGATKLHSTAQSRPAMFDSKSLGKIAPEVKKKLKITVVNFVEAAQRMLWVVSIEYDTEFQGESMTFQLAVAQSLIGCSKVKLRANRAVLRAEFLMHGRKGKINIKIVLHTCVSTKIGRR